MSPVAPRAQSLAQRLGRSLTLAVVPVWLLSTALVATYVNGEIQHNFDVELVESAHRQLYPALLEVDRAQPMALDEPLLMRTQPGPAHSEPLLLQLRGANGQVLLRSVATPASAFAVPLQAGFYETDDYRVFSLHDEVSGAWLQLADPLSERREASQRTVIGLVLVLLVMLPVLAWVITVVARRQLRTLEQLQQQITARSGSNLQPLELADMPLELCAVGDGVNQLLERLGEALNVERSLAANAAHELRTPLAEVRLRLQTAVDRAVADGGLAETSGQVPLDDVRQALRSLATLSHRTERLLQLSRAEGGPMHTLSSARRTCIAVLSAVECTATVRMPISWQARCTRSAISPRLAIRTLPNMEWHPGGPRHYSTIISGSPNSTGVPLSTRMRVTVPARGALI